MVLKSSSDSGSDADYAFDNSVASRIPPGGWDAEGRRLELHRDASVARASSWRWGVLGTLAVSLVWGWGFRWQMTAVESHNEAKSGAVMVNRWTGEVRWVQEGGWIKVEEVR